MYHECPLILSGGDTHQGLILQGLVHESTNTFAAFDYFAQRSYESGNVAEGVIVGTVTHEGQSCGVVVDSDCFNCSAVGDCEFHNKELKCTV